MSIKISEEDQDDWKETRWGETGTRGRGRGMGLRYIENESEDVYFNLALEEYLLQNFREGTYLLLWRNDRSIVLGKYQNVYEEVNLRAVEEAGIKVARRNSGGGTVYHDLGNLNYSILTDYDPNGTISYDLFLEPMISALRSMGIPAEKRGASDIAIEGMKISGSAQTL
ncbi:MAG TPA: lipoate--protein ligase family protein, partial [Clostridiaceae bacterium]|nr:lipoate--protein ligase family protein [Clostridiaceae bacterium]